MKMQEILEEFGFSKHAAEVYLALIEIGETRIGTLVGATRLHPQLIYNALAELEKASFAVHRIQRGRKYFLANSPKKLENLAQSRLEKLKEELPTLLAKYQHASSHAVQIVTGDQDFRRIRLGLLRSIPVRGDYYVIGTGGRLFMQAMEGTYREAEALRIRRRIVKHLIGFRGVADYTEAYRGQAELEERRYLPQQEESPTTTIFGGNQLALIIWHQPILTVLIESHELVQSYQTYFRLLWHQAVVYPNLMKK